MASRPWTWGVIGGSLNVLALLTVFGLVASGSVPPLWAVGSYLAGVLLIGLGEGAYRVSEAVDRDRVLAEKTLASATGATNLAEWLGERIKEVRALQGELDGLGPPSPEHGAGVRGVENSLNYLNQQVLNRIREERQCGLGYWLKRRNGSPTTERIPIGWQNTCSLMMESDSSYIDPWGKLARSLGCYTRLALSDPAPGAG